MSDSGILEGQCALITGGAADIGLAIAKRFDAEGARVAICDANEGALAKARKQYPHLRRMLVAAAGCLQSEILWQSCLL